MPVHLQVVVCGVDRTHSGCCTRSTSQEQIQRLRSDASKLWRVVSRRHASASERVERPRKLGVMSAQPHPALERVLRTEPAAAAMRLLTEEMSGTDLTTFLLEVARRRADRVEPADLIRQYQRDRFVAPAQVDPLRVAELGVRALRACAPRFTPVGLAPLAPFGTHAALGEVHQNNVVTTMRPGEVTADPTTALALEAAVQRRVLLANDATSSETVRLAAVDRVLRAQVFEGSRSFAHFTLLGLVTAGRDTGNQDFEAGALIDQIGVLTGWLRHALSCRLVVRLTDFGGHHGGVLDRAIAGAESDGVTCEIWPERTEGRGYYPTVCFKLAVVNPREEVEVGDGGFVDWTRDLLHNGKERLMIAGLSLERLAML